MSLSTVGVVLRDGPRVLGVEVIAPGGVVVRVANPLAAGQWIQVELRHGSFPAPLVVSGRVGWCRAAPTGAISAALELHGTWEGLSGVRRALLSVLASRVLDGERLVGWVLLDPETGSWAVHSIHSIKLAVLARDEAGRLVLRQRDGAALEMRGTGEALAHVFGLVRAPRLDPPLPNLESPSSPSDSSLPQEEVFAANTVVMKPEQAEVGGLGDIFAARTVNIPPESPGESSSEDLEGSRDPSTSGTGKTISQIRRRPKGGSSVIAPPKESGKHKRYSKILAGNETVGWIGATGEDSWSIFDPSGAKLAVLLRQEGMKNVRLCWFGDRADESLEFLEAPSGLEALAVAFELPASPRIEPRLPGLT